jgi:hypothetical protein
MQGVVASSSIELCVCICWLCVLTQMSHAYAAVVAAWVLLLFDCWLRPHCCLDRPVLLAVAGLHPSFMLP